MALNFQPSEREKGNATELKRESINKAMDFLGPQRKQTISSESLQKAQIQLNETSFTRATSESKITDEALKKSHREDAIQRIQAAQRGIDCRHLASEQQKERAATKIQALERGKQCRQQLAAEQLEKPEQDEKQQQEDAAMKIQKVQRGNASRKLDQEKKHAATKIQALERGRQCRQQLAAEQLEKPEQDEKQQQEDAAMKIQKVQRGNASRKLDQEKKHAATKIQALERGRQCRQQLAAEQLEKPEQDEKQQQEDAAMKIQKVQRGNASRKLDQEKKHAATKIQALERGRQCRQQLAAEQLDKPAEQDEKQQQEDAAMKIQKVQRGNASRKLDQEKKHAATKIQALERGRQCRQQLAAEQLDKPAEQDEKQQQEDAAMKIQKVQRGNASRKLDQEKKHAATKIQALERGRQCRQQLAAEQLDKQQQEEAAIKIQKLQRGKACRQQVSVERQQKEAAARRIQSLERGRQCRQQLEEDKRRQKEDAAAMKIQKIQRGNASRKQDQRKLEAATRIQSLERGRQCRQQLAQEKKQKQEQEDAAVKIQKIQRGKVARKVAETEREVRRKEEKAKRLCFPKRGAAPGAAVREVPPKTGTMAAGKSSRLRTYQLCHAEAKRQAQPKQSQADRVRQEPIGRSVTPGRSRHIRNTVGVSGQTPRSMTPGRVATKPPAKTPVTQIPKSAPQVAANQAGRASRSTTPAGRKNPVKAAMQSRQSPFNSDGPQSRAVHQISDFASSAQNLLGCRRVAAKLTEKRLESQQSKKELAEKQCAVACLIQACLKSGISRRRLEILHQKHVNAIKIQADGSYWDMATPMAAEIISRLIIPYTSTKIGAVESVCELEFFMRGFTRISISV